MLTIGPPTEDGDWRLPQLHQAAEALGYDAEVVPAEDGRLCITLSDPLGSSIQEMVYRDEAPNVVELMVRGYEMSDANLDSQEKRAKHAVHYAEWHGWDADVHIGEDGTLSVALKQRDGAVAGRIQLVSDTSGTAIRRAMSGMFEALYPTKR